MTAWNFWFTIPGKYNFDFIPSHPILRISRCHFVYMGKLADILVKTGHDVVSIFIWINPLFISINYQPLHTTSYNESDINVAKNIYWHPKPENHIEINDVEDDAWKEMSFWSTINRMNVIDKIKNSCEGKLVNWNLICITDKKGFDLFNIQIVIIFTTL